MSWRGGSRLHQTVELVRTTIDVVETQIDEVMPRADRPVLHPAIVAYSREVAFAAAEIYARAAELRGTWDARLEASVVDAMLRGETDDSVLSRASTLGWTSGQGVVVVVGGAPGEDTHIADAAAELEADPAPGGHRRPGHARRGAGRPDDRGARWIAVEGPGLDAGRWWGGS